MSNPFFDHPILNSPYEHPRRHWELDADGQPTQRIIVTDYDEEAWETLHSDTSRPFDKPEDGRIAVKVINHLGDEVMKVFRVE